MVCKMDLIATIKKRENDELHEKLASYEDKLLIASHTGALEDFDVAGFIAVRADSIRELLSHDLTTVVLVGGDLMRHVSMVVESLGVNVRVLRNVPGATPDPLFEQYASSLPFIDYVSLVGDIADRKFVEDSMSADELAASKANQQIDRLSDRHGNIKKLNPFNFDGGTQDNDNGTDS